jgi:hypothetical protein
MPGALVPIGMILVDVDEASTAVSIALYARVSSHDQRTAGRAVARSIEFARDGPSAAPRSPVER